jgi:glycosyltransferase involved in cell wall biosynthesis
LRGFDVILAPSLALPPKTTGATKLVVFCADLAFLHMPEAYPRWGRAFHQRGLTRAVREAALILTCSEASASDLLVRGDARLEQIRVIPLGADPPTPETAEGDDVARRSRLGLNGEPYFLWVGTQEPRKNLKATLAAFRQLADLPQRLVLAGPRGWRTADLQEMAGAEGVAGRVDVVGFVGPRDLSALYRGASAFCYPSHYEGFGLPVVEAMAHGTPVVTSNVSSLPEVAGDAALLVDPADPGALAVAMRRLVEDVNLRRYCVVAGHQQAAQYTWQASAAATWAAVRDAAAGVTTG